MSSFHGVGIEVYTVVSSFQGGGGGGVGIEVYRGVLISGGWNRGALLCVLHFSETSCTNKEIIAN